jgi:hypothetical protein
VVQNASAATTTATPSERRLAGIGITDVVSAPASPWQNPYVEHLIGSIRRECLDHVIVINAVHLRRVVATYRRYYHQSGTHLGLEKDTADHRPSSWHIGACQLCTRPEASGLGMDAALNRRWRRV